MDDRSETRRFLERHGMLAVRFDDLAADLLAEMEEGLAGRPSSLAMLPAWLAPVERIPTGDPVLAIDAGGTNFRAALVSFGPDGPAVEGFRSAEMPGSRGEIGREAFFDALAARVADLAARTGRIGFCFSYAMEILPDHEGRLLYFSKEIRAPEVEGTLVGAGLAEALERAGVRGRRTTVLLNDTTATLLAGRSAAEDALQYDGYVGYILGTGTNAAYLEASIPKAPGSAEQIVVLESGGFAVRGRGDLDEAFDRTTKDPGRYPCEKMHSGAYLGGLALAVLRAAAREGLFTGPAAAALEGDGDARGAGPERVPAPAVRRLAAARRGDGRVAARPRTRVPAAGRPGLPRGAARRRRARGRGAEVGPGQAREPARVHRGGRHDVARGAGPRREGRGTARAAPRRTSAAVTCGSCCPSARP